MDLQYKSGECYYNAVLNKEKVEKLYGKKFKVVIGGLAFNGWFEYGSKTPTDKNYTTKPLDSHAWLESDDGVIVDYMFPHYEWVCEENKLGKPRFPINELVSGNRKTLKKKYALEYVVADEKLQEQIFERVKKEYEFRFRYGLMDAVEMVR